MAAHELFKRYERNPIITADIFPEHMFIHSVFNPGVGDLHGETLLLVRAQDMEGLSKLVCITSKNGITDWKIDESTIFMGNKKAGVQGVEDARLTWMPTLQEWAFVYTNLLSGGGYLLSIALTRDFKKYTYLDNVLPVKNKDAALFPRPINGYWWLIHRPTTEDKQIWICRSRCDDIHDAYDLRRWGEHEVLLSTDGTDRWDGKHIGLSTPPLETKEGWFAVYHGVKNESYYLGLLMLALDNPMKITHRTKRFVLAPQEKDFMGEVGGAIFPCGCRVNDDGMLLLYYGAADSVICVAIASLDEVIKRVMDDPV